LSYMPSSEQTTLLASGFESRNMLRRRSNSEAGSRTLMSLECPQDEQPN
jgi:hypothetical protein